MQVTKDMTKKPFFVGGYRRAPGAMGLDKTASWLGRRWPARARAPSVFHVALSADSDLLPTRCFLWPCLQSTFYIWKNPVFCLLSKVLVTLNSSAQVGERESAWE